MLFAIHTLCCPKPFRYSLPNQEKTPRLLFVPKVPLTQFKVNPWKTRHVLELGGSFWEALSGGIDRSKTDQQIGEHSGMSMVLSN